jgi:hypothetical protein
MARRQIGQEEILAILELRSGTVLQRFAALINWGPIERYLIGSSARSKGEPG